MKIRQSVCFPMIKPADMPLDELCKQSKAIGYQAIELWGRGDDFPAVVETARRHNLAIATICGHGLIGSGLNDVAQHDRIEAELRASIDIAAKHGIPGVICFAGNRLNGQSDDEAMVVCARGLKRITPYAEQKRVNLNVELLNSKVNHPGYLGDRTDWGLAMCELAGSERAKLLYDIYHMQIMEGDVIRTIRKAIGRIGHFHTAGNPGRNDFDDTQELNYRGICRAIAATGYNLFVGHEFKPLGDTIAALRSAFAMCDQG
jgi:hydroxypyruvate isomerase